MTTDLATGLVHGSAIAVNGTGLLLIGPAGSGKSGLALRMMALGADLVADDQVLLASGPDGPTASAPATLSGKIEARCLGIIEHSCARSCKVTAVVDLTTSETDRLPPMRKINIGTQQIDLLYGADVPNLAYALIVMLQGRRLPDHVGV